MKVYITRHQHGYKVRPIDDEGNVLADFWGKDAKNKALEFIREKGYELVYTCC